MAELGKNGAIFISGWGSNLQVFLDQKHRFENLTVVSSSKQAHGLSRARDCGVESIVLGRPIDWQGLSQSLKEKSIDFIFCAGFMKIIPASFVADWETKIFNLHPSKLPKYKGIKAIERAFEAKDEIAVSIHHLVPEVDAGEVIMQTSVWQPGSYSNLNIDEVREKVRATEHLLVSQWIDWILK